MLSKRKDISLSNNHFKPSLSRPSIVKNKKNKTKNFNSWIYYGVYDGWMNNEDTYISCINNGIWNAHDP